mmetsp:Transcript_29080/g.94808  ORF Transcript_29080/g.94808 Transcript_29080/m.94808 type:complete len:275 (-) Transcript_29080:2009-2833(-)
MAADADAAEPRPWRDLDVRDGAIMPESTSYTSPVAADTVDTALGGRESVALKSSSSSSTSDRPPLVAGAGSSCVLSDRFRLANSIVWINSRDSRRCIGRRCTFAPVVGPPDASSSPPPLLLNPSPPPPPPPISSSGAPAAEAVPFHGFTDTDRAGGNSSASTCPDALRLSTSTSNSSTRDCSVFASPSSLFARAVASSSALDCWAEASDAAFSAAAMRASAASARFTASPCACDSRSTSSSCALSRVSASALCPKASRRRTTSASASSVAVFAD